MSTLQAADHEIEDKVEKEKRESSSETVPIEEREEDIKENKLEGNVNV